MTLIKICGITNADDALVAARLKVDMLGFVFYPRSPRSIRSVDAAAIIQALPRSIGKIGVFVDEKVGDVLAIAREAGLTGVQFHGDEPPDYCSRFVGAYTVIKAFRLRSADDLSRANEYPVDYLLFDAYAPGAAKGGLGISFDWTILKGRAMAKPVIVSGGLTSATVGLAIQELSPFGVDVSTGVEEAPGKKSPGLMEQFVQKVRVLE